MSSKQIDEVAKLMKVLSSKADFPRSSFLKVRRKLVPQRFLADMMGVQPSTISNWETGHTKPLWKNRILISEAFGKIIDHSLRQEDLPEGEGQVDLFDVVSPNVIKLREYANGREIVNIDVDVTRHQLSHSILNAALTDFLFDEKKHQIVPLPFERDDRVANIKKLHKDRNDLLRSLSVQARLISDGVDSDRNIDSAKFKSYFNHYSEEAGSENPNPRLLHRLGQIISKRTSVDEVRAAISDWDGEAIDGFNADHMELVRLYFREALAKAQEIEALPFVEGASKGDSANQFFEAADLIESVAGKKKSPLYDPSIPALLKDIGNEVRSIEEEEAYTFNDERRRSLRRQKVLAIKNGSIFVGRVLFFSSLFLVVSPGALASIGSVASILGLVDVVVPGSMRQVYERLRISLPILPKLPTKDR